MANDPALQALAEMLIKKQRAIATPGVNVASSPPPLPAYQQPGQTMNSFAPMPSVASLYDQYQRGQKAQQPQTPPQAAPVASPTAAPLSPQMPAADTNAGAVPPMPPPTAIGQAPGMQQPSVLETIWNQLKQQRGNQPPPSWAQNFGNLADSQGG